MTSIKIHVSFESNLALSLHRRLNSADLDVRGSLDGDFLGLVRVSHMIHCHVSCIECSIECSSLDGNSSFGDILIRARSWGWSLAGLNGGSSVVSTTWSRD